MNIFNITVFAFLVTAILSYLITPYVIKASYKLGIVDDPKKNKHPKVIHTYPVPRGGGLAIFLAFLISALIFLPFDKHLKGIIAGAIILTVLGIADDKYNLNPYFRLFMQFVAVSMPVVAGIGIPFINNPLTSGIIDLSQPQISFEILGRHSIWIISDLF